MFYEMYNFTKNDTDNLEKYYTQMIWKFLSHFIWVTVRVQVLLVKMHLESNFV